MNNYKYTILSHCKNEKCQEFGIPFNITPACSLFGKHIVLPESIHCLGCASKCDVKINVDRNKVDDET